MFALSLGAGLHAKGLSFQHNVHSPYHFVITTF